MLRDLFLHYHYIQSNSAPVWQKGDCEVDKTPLTRVNVWNAWYFTCIPPVLPLNMVLRHRRHLQRIAASKLDHQTCWLCWLFSSHWFMRTSNSLLLTPCHHDGLFNRLLNPSSILTSPSYPPNFIVFILAHSACFIVWRELWCLSGKYNWTSICYICVGIAIITSQAELQTLTPYISHLYVA